MLILQSGILYNEILYLNEWIEFHKKQGVKMFYIGVKYKKEKNNKIFENLINKYKNDTTIIFYHLKQEKYTQIYYFFKNYYEKHFNDWIAIIDIDEFLYSPIKNKKITDIIDIYEKKKIYAIGINWKCFGSNNIEKNPDNKVLEKFTKCAKKYNGINCTIKTLVKINVLNINKIKSWNIHKFILKDKYNYYTSTCIRFITNNKNNNINLKKERDEYLKQLGYNPPPINYNSLYTYPEKDPNLVLNHYITRYKYV